jgi:LPS-assembly lipoprotein
MKYKHSFLLFILFFLLAGCGFHLRGQTPIAPELQILYLKTPQPYGPFAVQLRRGLCSLGIVLVESIKNAPRVLHILDDSLGQQLTAISANTQVRTYTLTYSIAFQIEDAHGQIILPAQTVSTVSTYQTSVIQTLGDRDVLNTVQEEMRRDAIGQIINRLNAKNSRLLLQQSHCVPINENHP